LSHGADSEVMPLKHRWVNG